MKLRPFTEYNADARVIGEPKIGRDCWIGPFCILDASGGLEIGDHCTIAAGTHIYTHQSGAGRCSKIERKSVKIGSNVYVGPHVVISMGVTIGDGAVIGANSYVDADVAAGSRAWGNPAEVQRPCCKSCRYFEVVHEIMTLCRHPESSRHERSVGPYSTCKKWEKRW